MSATLYLLPPPEIFEFQGRLSSASSISATNTNNTFDLQSLRQPLNKKIEVVKTGNSSSMTITEDKDILRMNNFSDPSLIINARFSNSTLSSSSSSSFIEAYSKLVKIENEICDLEQRIGQQEIYGICPRRVSSTVGMVLKQNNHSSETQQQQNTIVMMRNLKDAWAKLEQTLNKRKSQISDRNANNITSSSSENLMILEHQDPVVLLQSTAALCSEAEIIRRSWGNILDQALFASNTKNDNFSIEQRKEEEIQKSKALDDLEEKIATMEEMFAERRRKVLEKVKELEDEVQASSGKFVMEWSE